MAITAKLREDGSGGAENPWATDLDSVALDIGNAGTSGTPSIQISGGEILMNPSATATRQHATGASSTFANGVVRGKVSLSNVSSSQNNAVGLELRCVSGASGTGIQATLHNASLGGSEQKLVVRKSWTYVADIDTTLVAGTKYELVVNAYDTDKMRCVKYDVGAFPPGSDYKTITWDIDRSAGTDGFPAAAGYVGVASRKDTASALTHSADDVVSWSGGSVTVGTVSVTAGNTLVNVAWTDAAALQKSGAAWYFLRYKAGSQPADENDGTLVTGAGTGLSGSAIRSDGRFLDDPADFSITGLSNGTTYYVRPFAMGWDAAIVAGTAQSATPTGAADTTAPTAPTDFVAAYDGPFVASKIVLTATQPAEAGDYKITYRIDGTNPTSSTDGTILVNWTAYASGVALSTSATSLTDGKRYRFALWNRDAASNISTGAQAQLVSVHQVTLYQPTDGATGEQLSPYLVWHTSAGEAEESLPIHYKVEVATVEDGYPFTAFIAGTFFTASSLDDGISGFEYESSAGVWVALPVTGLAAANVGKDVRYHLSLTQTGQYFWRVSPQQPSS